MTATKTDTAGSDGSNGAGFSTHDDAGTGPFRAAGGAGGTGGSGVGGAAALRTPMPWPAAKYDDHGNGSFWEIAGVAKVYRAADAALIFRAVNSHDALVTALREVLAALPSFMRDADRWARATAAARAALAAATETEE